jgi:hypothetical protein
MLDGMINSLTIGETAELLVARDENLFSVKIRMTNYRKPTFKFEKQTNSKYETEYNFWLR